MAHRLILTTEATVENVDAHDIVTDALDAVEVPAVSPYANSALEDEDHAPVSEQVTQAQAEDGTQAQFEDGTQAQAEDGEGPGEAESDERRDGVDPR
jgi:MoxR-like ATPase